MNFLDLEGNWRPFSPTFLNFTDKKNLTVSYVTANQLVTDAELGHRSPGLQSKALFTMPESLRQCTSPIIKISAIFSPESSERD